MYAITVSEKDGETRRLEFDKPEITIGRVQGNDIVLPKGNVSKRHSRLVMKDGKLIIVDLKSTNGTYVNGRKITSPIVIKGTDKVYIGDFVISVDEQPIVETPSAPPPAIVPARNATMPPPPPQRRMAQPVTPMNRMDSDGDSEPPPSPTQLANSSPMFEPPPPVDEPTDEPQPAVAAAARPVRASSPPAQEPRAQRQAQRPAAMADPPRNARDGGAGSGGPSRAAVVTAQRIPVAPPSVVAQSRSGVGGGAAARRDAAMASAPPVPLAAALAQRGAAAADWERTRSLEALQHVTLRLAAMLNPDTLGREQLGDPELWERADRMAHELVGDLGDLGGIDGAALAQDAVSETLGIGPLEALLGDPSVREISVPRHDRVFVVREGDRTLSNKVFSSAEAVGRIVQRLSEGGAPRNGVIEARLPDGVVMVAAVEPVVARGAVVTLRRPRREPTTLGMLVMEGALSQGMADFLELAVRERRNILVTGAASGPRSTVVAALAHAADPGDLVVLVEEGEHESPHEHAVASLTTRGGPRQTLAAALKLHPDRLVVDDSHGQAAVVAVEAMVALPGTIAAAPGTSGADGVSRFIAQARMSAGAPDGDLLRDTVADHLDLVVHVARGTDHRVRIVSVADLERIDNRGRPTLADVFVFKGEGERGSFAPTGHVPSFAEKAPPSMFKN